MKFGRHDVADATVYSVMESPVGRLVLFATDDGLTAIAWDDASRAGRAALAPLREDDAHPVVARARRQLREYFAGERTEFDVPLVIRGTPFQERVWGKLLEIPYGETRSYEEQALAVGGAGKVRAVGAANGRNPIPIIVPCHRVVGKDGSLTGFGGGLDRKRLLLDLEGARVQGRLPGLE